MQWMREVFKSGVEVVKTYLFIYFNLFCLRLWAIYLSFGGGLRFVALFGAFWLKVGVFLVVCDAVAHSGFIVVGGS